MKKWVLLFLIVCSGCANFTLPVIGNGEEGIDYAAFEELSSQAVPWGLGKNKNEYKQPIDALNANDRYRAYDSVFVGDAKEKIIYLTFDNGYENGYTEPVLDILMENDVSAMFFLTYDYVKENETLTRRMIRDGHQIGNHTYKHKSFIETSLVDIAEDISLFEDYMHQNYYYHMEYMRPPKGEFTEQSLALVQELGLKTVLWSFAYYDYNVDDQYATDVALEKLKEGLHPGAIYLLHCVSQTNSEILQDFIVYAKAEGYTFSLLDF